MSALERCELLMQGKNYSGSGNWLDETVNGHDGVITGAAFLVDRFVLDGTDFITIPDDAGLDFTADEDFTILVAGNVTDESTTQGWFTKKNNTGSGKGWMLNSTTGGPAIVIGDGTQVQSDRHSALTNDTDVVIVGVRDALGADDIETFVDGTGTGSPSGSAALTATFANALDVLIGREDDGGIPFTGEIYAVAVWREALSDAEVLEVSNNIAAGWDPPVPDVVTTRRIISSPRYGITRMARR